jgi:hypothetical protein
MAALKTVLKIIIQFHFLYKNHVKKIFAHVSFFLTSSSLEASHSHSHSHSVHISANPISLIPGAGDELTIKTIPLVPINPPPQKHVRIRRDMPAKFFAYDFVPNKFCILKKPI